MGFGFGIRLTTSKLSSEVNPFASLMSILLSGAAQLIAHPLEYGSMFQDRAGTTPVTAPGQLVGHCLDAGPGGYHATAISDAARGVFREVDGIRYIEYNGVNTAYSTPALPAPLVDKAQVFAGQRKDGASSSNRAIINQNLQDSPSFSLRAPDFLGNNYGLFFRGSGAIQAISSLNTFPPPHIGVLSGIIDLSGSAVLRVNGAQIATVISNSVVNFGAFPLFLGSFSNNTGFFNGRHYATLGPITRFSAANATPQQIEAAEAYYTARVI